MNFINYFGIIEILSRRNNSWLGFRNLRWLYSNIFLCLLIKICLVYSTYSTPRFHIQISQHLHIFNIHINQPATVACLIYLLKASWFSELLSLWKVEVNWILMKHWKYWYIWILFIRNIWILFISNIWILCISNIWILFNSNICHLRSPPHIYLIS